MNDQIITVTGPVPSQSLGVTSMHEHLVTTNGEVFREVLPSVSRRFPESADIWDLPLTLQTAGRRRLDFAAQRANLSLDDDELIAAEMVDFRRAGGAAMLDASGIGLRGDPRRIRRLSAKSGVTIVASTGFYVSHFIDDVYRSWPVSQIAELMIHEVREGIGKTDVRAGHIKCGVTSLDPVEERVLHAAAQAAGETGAAVTVHPGFTLGSDGRRIAGLLIDAGLAPDRLILAHSEAFMVGHQLDRLVLDPSSWALSLDYHRELLRRGVNLSVDCFGHDWWRLPANLVLETDWQRLGGLVALIGEGWSRQLVVGTDTFIPSLTRRRGGHGYCHLVEFVLPALREVGVSDWDIRQLTIENPRRLLTLDKADA